MDAREGVALPAPDTDAPEVIAVHLYHHPDNPDDLNGITFVMRSHGRSFTVAVREGVLDDGVESVPATPLQTGGAKYLELTQDRGELFATLVQEIGSLGPSLARLAESLVE